MNRDRDGIITATLRVARFAEWLAAHARAVILAAFAILALPYAFATPIFEKNDEAVHFAFARHLAQGNGLPVQRLGSDSPWQQAGSQPPLYYLLAAQILRAFNTSDFDAQRQPNQTPLNIPYAPGNKNMLLITPEKRPFDYRDTTLAAVMLRILGIVPGLATVWFAWGIADAVTGRRGVTILATCLTAFNPMFLTVTTAVSNDGLVIALSTAALYVLVRWVMRGAIWQHVLLAGVSIALASLAKVSGAVLLPIAVLVALIKPIGGLNVSKPDKEDAEEGEDMGDKEPTLSPLSSPSSLSRFASVALIVVPFALITGWWFARNLVLYGDLTGTSTMAAVAGERSLSLPDALGEFQGFRMSYLAMFGQFNVPADDIAYQVWDMLLILSAAGLALHVALRRQHESSAHWRAVALITLHILLTLAAIVRWTMMTPASHGRLLFPAIAGVSVLMALGLDAIGEWFKRIVPLQPAQARAISRTPAAFTIVGMAVLAAVAPFRNVIPAYRPPLAAEMPAGFTPINQTLTPWAEVLGYAMEPRDARPGDKVRVKVFMRALKTPQFNWSLVTNLYGRDDAPLARFDTFTGGGLLPSSEWQPGQTWVDTVEFTLPPDARAPAILRAQFNLYNAGSGEIATSLDAKGDERAPLYDGSTLLPLGTLSVTPAIGRFGDLAQLGGLVVHQDPQAITLNLRWEALGRAAADYSVFVHVVDASGRLVAQQDAQPIAGQFPTTRWQAGVRFEETRTVTLPSTLPGGTYALLMGIYDPKTGTRLKAHNGDGDRAENDAFRVGEIRVVKSP